MLKQQAYISTAVGVDITINIDGSWTVHACRVTTSGNQLEIVQKEIGLTSIEALADYFAPKTLATLNINGKGVLHKQTDKINDLTQNHFAQLFPNTSLQDFYVQNFISGEQSFISLIRKNEADKILEQLKQAGFVPVMLSLGPFAITHVLPQLNSYDETVLFNGHILHRDEQSNITAYKYDASASSPFQLKIESEKIDERLLLAYAVAFQLVLAQRLEPVKVNSAPLDGAYAEVLSQKKLRTQGSVILSITFLLLLINFVVFSWLNGENSAMAYRVSRSVKSTEDIKGTQDEIRAKEQELQVLGWDGGINKAVLLDRMAACMPADLTWKEIAVNPVDVNQSRTQKMLVFKERQIHVVGLSARILPVNEWMARLKSQKWVKDVQLEDYTVDTEKDTGRFTLTVNY